jgi:hypothetical protein
LNIRSWAGLILNLSPSERYGVRFPIPSFHFFGVFRTKNGLKPDSPIPLLSALKFWETDVEIFRFCRNGPDRRLGGAPNSRVDQLKFHMAKWLKNRLEIIKLTLRNPVLLVVFGILFVSPFVLVLVPALKLSNWMPWYGWVMGWFAFLWFASIEYSAQRKEVFDQTSIAFFKAYLDSLIKQGNNLFNYSEEKDFYSKINDWQHRVIQGLAIGLGHEASEKYFHKMDSKNPLAKGGQPALALRTSEALCRILQENIEELNLIRIELKDIKGDEAGDLEIGNDIKMLGESKK